MEDLRMKYISDCVKNLESVESAYDKRYYPTNTPLEILWGDEDYPIFKHY
jgi:hypothetical protein